MNEEVVPTPTQNSQEFLLRSLQLILSSQDEAIQVHKFWQVNIAQFNPDLLKELPSLFSEINQGNEIQKVSSTADLFVAFGDLVARFPSGQRWLNLELAITAYSLALQVYNPQIFAQEWAKAQNNLANVYSDRIRGDRAENIEAAIDAYQQALMVRTKSAMPVEWAATMNNLAVTYRSRIRGDRAENIEAAIDAYQQALTVRTKSAMPVEWAATMNNLAITYYYRIKEDRAENIEAAIDAYQQALAIRTRDAMPIEWAQTVNNLAAAYSDRILGDRAENIETAIDAYQQVLIIRTQDAMPIEWATTMNNLANAYFSRILGDRAENIEVAIDAYQQALSVTTQIAMPVDWAQTMNNLATAYRKRIRGDRAENIEAAIDAYQQALTVTTRSRMPVDWAIAMNNLANAYYFRIRGDRAENIEAAIDAYQQALTVTTRSRMPIDWAQTMNNLAAAYSERIRGDRAENIEAAIDAYQQALTVRTQSAMPVEWAQTSMNLAVAYRLRIRGDRAENIEKAISAYQQALTVRTQSAMPVEWAQTSMNLGNAYYYRIRGDRAENIEKAISAYQQALTVRTQSAMPVEWAQTSMNLGNAYYSRLKGDRAKNIEAAIDAYQQALTVRTQSAMPVEWAQTSMNLAVAYSDRIKGNHEENIGQAVLANQSSLTIFQAESFPHECRKVSFNLGNLHFNQQNWTQAAAYYQQALQAHEILYQSAIFLEGKAAELTEIANLTGYTAYAHARTGDLETAILTLERGRIRELSEKLDRDLADLTQLRQINPNLYTEYQTIAFRIRTFESRSRLRTISDERYDLTDEALRVEAQYLRQSLNEVIEQVRQVPGYESFLTQPNFEDIYTLLRPDIPLAYFVSTSAGSLTLILTQDNIFTLWYDDLTNDDLIDLLNDLWFNAYDQSRSHLQIWLEAIDQATQQLWQPLMSPLIDLLKQQSFQQATLIPTGYLCFLPLHATWTEDSVTATARRYAFDDIHFTYAPNARSLNVAATVAQRTDTSAILAIDNPRNDLPNSSHEVAVAIANFPQHQVLKHEEATISSVLSALPYCNVLHLSCHGTANLEEPLNSGVLMSDGFLTLRELLDLRLIEQEQGGIRLAVLSACETGLVGVELADEAIGLPIGLLQAGVAGVIASLWSVSDLSTTLLLTRFYDLWRTEGLEISQALRQAQQWVRDTTNIQKYSYLKDAMQKLVDAQLVSLQESNNILRELMLHYIYTDGPQGQSFAHPFHWAAFTYVGV